MELGEKEKYFYGLRDNVNSSFAELQKKVKNLSMDTTGARIELLIDTLQEIGVLSKEQRLDFEIAFYEKIANSLKEMWTQLQEQERNQHPLKVVKNPGLIVPNHARKK